MEDKGNSNLKVPFLVVVLIMLAFLVSDLSLTYFVVGSSLVPVVNLMPLIQMSLI